MVQSTNLQLIAGRMKVDRALLPMKLHYFLFNAGASCILPFLPVMAKGMGLSSIVVGTIYTILPIMGMLVKPLLGAAADRYKAQRALCIGCIVACAIFLFTIPWIPALPSEAKGAVHCGESVSELKLTLPKEDKCLENRLAAYPPDSTFQCAMRCYANSTMLEAVCQYWGQPQFCSQLPQASRFHAMVVKAALPPANVTLDLEPASRLIYAASPQQIQFQGTLRADKNELVGNSLFFRLQTVGFPNGGTAHPYCNNSLQEMSCDLDCDSPLVNSLFINPAIPDSEAPQLYQFWLLTLSIVIAWIGQAGGVSLADAICFEMLGDFPSKYGGQRLWGSIGWGSFSIIAGVAVDHFSSGATKNYLPAVSIMLVLFILNVVVLARMDYRQTKSSASILNDVGKLFSDLRILVFMVWCIVVGMGTALVWNFLLWYLEDLAAEYSCDMSAWIKTLEGLVMGIECFGGELPFFFLSGRILKRLGHVNCMTLVLFALGVRFILYSLIVNPWMCVPIELLNGVTFGLFYATMASYASIVAPPGTESTMQGLVGAIFEGVGVSLGSFFGGILFNHIGSREAFRIFGFGALGACVVHAAVQFLINRRYPAAQLHERDFKQVGYSSPPDAILMLGEPLTDAVT